MDTAIDYLRDRYLEEQSRFDHFENKCSRFLTFATVIIALLSAMLGMNEGAIFNPTSGLDWAIVTLLICGFFSILCAWGHSLLALRIAECSIMPKNKETAEYLSRASDAEAKKHIFQCYVDTLENLSNELESKSKYLEIAYSELIISAWCLSIAAGLITIMELIR